MANPTRISLLRAQLIRRNIRVTNDWLEGCVEYFLGERPNITDQELLEVTFQQYLLADVCEVGVPCIPENIVRVKEMQVIEGRFTVQMQYVMNVSESPYDLLQQLYKKQLDETDEEQQNRRNNKSTVKKQRMLKLELTDGKTTCSAMEYSPIPQLHVNLRPGTKVRIIGPIKCINHVLFLEAKNIEVLGGEVDTLLIINAFENMLLKALNKPINPDPKAEYAEITQSTGNITRDAAQIMNGNSSFNGMRTIDTYMTPTRPTTIRNPFDDDPFEDSDVFAQVNLDEITSHARPSAASTAIVNPFEDDDLDDVDALAQIEEKVLRQQSTSNRKRPSTGPVPSTSNFMYCEPPMEDQSIVQASKVPKLEGFDDDDDEDFELMVAAAMNDLTPPPVVATPPVVQFHDKDYKFRLEGCNLLTFDQLKIISQENRRDQMFMFYAETKQVTKPLNISEERWTLEVTIEDVDDNSLNVALDPKLLDTMIGYSAKEVKLMRQRAKIQPALKEEIIMILKRFNDLLKSERRFWKIKFTEATIPVVVSTANLKPVYRRILMNKIEAENLESLRGTVPD